MSSSNFSISQAALDSLSMPVLVVEGTGRIQLLNPAAAQFWHMTPEKLGQQTLQQLFGRDSQLCAHLARALVEETSYTIDPYTFDQGEGQPPLLLRVQIDPVQVPRNQGELAVVTFWDQTHREHLEDRERERRLMDSIGLMVKRLAHELHNPLSGVKGATQLLARQVEGMPELRGYPEIILREMERLERLVKNLLLQGGGQPLNRTRFNVHELLDNLIWFQSNSAGQESIRFERDYDPSLPELFADQDRMHQVFLNLIQNAVDASPPGAMVTLRTRALGPWQEDETLPDPARTYYQVEVVDQGEGVDNEILPNLFTPFYSNKKSGNGLGLSISYQIVRAHGGLLRYRAAQPGAVFSVILPLEDQGAPGAED
ncbi:MAG: ATP-binding protein [SAR324 cluster bacterium]|nr:ATP-binding protein [SAR324 cluster bacterium]